MSQSTCALTFAAAFAVLAGPAFAQGTDAQREACTPDAVRLCQDTIPDIPKTTACMERHRAELSPQCRAVMSDDSPARTRAAETPRVRDAERMRRRADRDPGPEDEDYGPRGGRGGPDRFGYGPGGEDDGPPDRPPPGYGRRGYGPPDADRADDGGPPPGYIPPGARRYRYLTPNGDPAVTPEGGARARARAEIGRLCEDDMIDPRTCAETDRALRR